MHACFLRQLIRYQELTAIIRAMNMIMRKWTFINGICHRLQSLLHLQKIPILYIDCL